MASNKTWAEVWTEISESDFKRLGSCLNHIEIELVAATPKTLSAHPMNISMDFAYRINGETVAVHKQGKWWVLTEQLKWMEEKKINFRSYPEAEWF